MFDIKDLETIAEMTDSVYFNETEKWYINDIQVTLTEKNERMYIKADGYDYKYVYNGVEIWEYINYVFK